MRNWRWNAWDKAKRKKPIVVEAPTYVAALSEAAYHFGFVVHHPNGDSPQLWMVEVEVVRS